MDPPSHQIRRRAVSDQHSQITSQRYIPDGSPSPFVPPTSETRRPRTSHTVSGVLDVGQDAVTRNTESLQILEECVETKTVTTTTTIQRAWPQFPIHRPQILETLDAKRYPLASKPTPFELTNFSYEVDGQTINFCGDDHHRYTDESSLSRSYPRPDTKVKESSNSTKHDAPNNTQTKKKRAQINHGRSLRALSCTGTKSPIPGRGQQQNSSVLDRHTADEELILNNERRPRHKRVNLHMSRSTLLATPDTSELDLPASGLRRSSVPSFTNTQTPELSQNDSFDEFIAPSPSEPLNDGSFPSAVATPPIAESDLEPFEGVSAAFAHVSVQRPTLNTAAAQNASLPSPGLSPTFAASEIHSGQFPGGDHDFDEVDDLTEATQSGDSQETINEHKIRTPRSRAVHADEDCENSSLLQRSHVPTVMDTRSMIDTFDSMPDNMKSFMMYQLLRRCSRKTLHVIADVVNPALKCDFLDQLPVELRLHILSFLDYKDLCRAAQVSKKWREVVNTNETGWKELLDRDGYVLPTGELERAIHQGWGWQDPYGLDGYEQDLSVQGGVSGGAISTDSDLTILGSHKLENDNVRKVRSTTKRKRTTGNSSSERAKRRAVGHEFAGKAHELLSKYPYTANFHKSEGPLTAANAAALAVPDPKIGPPGFQQLHLFKSLYRRHSMLRRSWTNGKMEPHHLAFPAHPAHVITCLQFDDDKILTGSDDTLIHVYDTKTGQLRKKLEGHEGGVWALQYEGNVLVSGSTDRSVRVWDIEKGLCTQVFHGHTSTVRCLQILMPVDTGRIERGKPVMMPEKPLIITGSRDSQLRVWRLPEQGSKRYIQTGPPANDADCPYFVRVLNGHTHSVRAIAAHQDTLVSGSYDFTVRVWKISTGETVHRLQGHTMKVYSVVLDHKRNRCISGSMDNFVKIWSLETGSCLFTLEGHSSLVGLLDLRDDRLVSAAADSTLRIWDPENGQCKSTLSAHTGAITCFQHDGQKVISGSDRTLKMWNVKTGECIKDLLTDLSGVWQVKFDQRRCVAAVQRDSLTFVEVLDFGASRDGIPASQRGSRVLLNNDVEISDRVVEEEDTLL